MLDFKTLFLEQEASEDEDAASLAECLNSLDAMFSHAATFSANDLATHLNQIGGADHAQVVREYLFPTLGSNDRVTSRSVGKRLKAHVGEPVRYGDKTLVLKSEMDKHRKAFVFRVRELTAAQT